jgi:membrane-associated phospholipid phosphatase
MRMWKLWPFKGMPPVEFFSRIFMWAFTLFLCILGYGVGKLELFATAQTFELTALDNAIPLLPWTIWIYGSVTSTFLIAWMMVPNIQAAKKLFFSTLLPCVCCWFFFIFWPTTFPRELWPLPDGQSRTLLEFQSLRLSDSPSNCFPSMHVAMAFGIALAWKDFLKGWAKPIPLIWASLVSICTLTTKQHYFYDIPPGILVAFIGWWASCWLTRPKHRPSTLSLGRPQDKVLITAMLERVASGQWSLDDIQWPTDALPPLPRKMSRLLNHIIYIEEIAGLNFDIQARACADPDLKALYSFFSQEERRHANGLRKVLELHGAKLEPPGLGNAITLQIFEFLNPKSRRDMALVSMSTPVFETFLDAGTIPFLQNHPLLQNPAFDEFVSRVCQDESQHLALNWLICREIARKQAGWKGLAFFANPSVFLGVCAVPWMSLDVYSIAHALGYRFETLLPSFKKLWRLHLRYAELEQFLPWQLYRVFIICGWVATKTCVQLARFNMLFVGWWGFFTRLTDYFAWWFFGENILRRKGLTIKR